MTTWIVGIDNPHSNDPDKALEPTAPGSSAGGRLFAMSDMSLEDYLEAFRRVNVIDRPFQFSRGDVVVVLGLRPWTKLRLPLVANWFGELDWFDIKYVLVPHPSGRSLIYNDPENRERLRELLQEYSGKYEMMIRRPDRETKPIQRRGAKLHWTQEDKAELRRLAKTMNLNQLARHFDRTTSAILAMAYKLDVTVRHSQKNLLKEGEE
jgi:hypothetical protein